MVDIHALHIRIITGLVGTDGHPYLGIDGREFYVDSEDHEGFKPRSDHIYIAGQLPSPMPTNASEIRNPGHNDPRIQYPLDTDDLDKYHVYLRFEPRDVNDSDDIWSLQYVSVQVFSQRDPRPVATYEALEPASDDLIYLRMGGRHFGKYVYLHEA